MRNVLKFLVVSFTLLSCFAMEAQELVVKGVVSDGDGPLPTAKVLNVNSKASTISDFDGNYSIVAKKGDVLEFTYMGYTTVRKTIYNETTIHVTLMINSKEAINVTVKTLGRKVQPRTSTFSVQTYGGEENTKTRQAAVANALSGKVPGIKVTYAYGAPSIHKPLPPSYQEQYEDRQENTFQSPSLQPLSTFSVDVDKASYANVRRMLNNGQEIPKEAVKVEEMVNYFHYNYPTPTNRKPFAVHTEYGACAWNDKHHLLKIGIKGKEIPQEKLPPSNLVFLLDVSGSMHASNKLPLLKESLKILVRKMRKQDRVAIVVYAGAAGEVLPSTSGENKEAIIAALDKLSAGGSTAGGAGIALAYKIAQENFIQGGNNRVVLGTDGDFNVGVHATKDLQTLIEEKRETGVFLTALGFGMGNYKDEQLETLADKGNGNHAYIDTMQEAQKVLDKEFSGTMYAIAKDVKLQVEFNPTQVQAYRLIGYENRMLEAKDFKDDKKDAGEIGSGHTVTALYEVIPVGVKSSFTKNLPSLKYTKTGNNKSTALATVKVRYKKPDGDKSMLLEREISNTPLDFADLTVDFQFASAIAGFGMLLQDSKYVDTSNWNTIREWAEKGRGLDKEGYRAEAIRLMELSQEVQLGVN